MSSEAPKILIEPKPAAANKETELPKQLAGVETAIRPFEARTAPYASRADFHAEALPLMDALFVLYNDLAPVSAQSQVLIEPVIKKLSREARRVLAIPGHHADVVAQQRAIPAYLYMCEQLAILPISEVQIAAVLEARNELTGIAATVTGTQTESNLLEMDDDINALVDQFADVEVFFNSLKSGAYIDSFRRLTTDVEALRLAKRIPDVAGELVVENDITNPIYRSVAEVVRGRVLPQETMTALDNVLERIDGLLMHTTRREGRRVLRELRYMVAELIHFSRRTQIGRLRLGTANLSASDYLRPETIKTNAQRNGDLILVFQAIDPEFTQVEATLVKVAELRSKGENLNKGLSDTERAMLRRYYDRLLTYLQQQKNAEDRVKRGAPTISRNELAGLLSEVSNYALTLDGIVKEVETPAKATQPKNPELGTQDEWKKFIQDGDQKLVRDTVVKLIVIMMNHVSVAQVVKPITDKSMGEANIPDEVANAWVKYMIYSSFDFTGTTLVDAKKREATKGLITSRVAWFNIYADKRESNGGMKHQDFWALGTDLDYGMLGGQSIEGLRKNLRSAVPFRNLPDGKWDFPVMDEVRREAIRILGNGLFGFDTNHIGNRYGDLGTLLYEGKTITDPSGRVIATTRGFENRHIGTTSPPIDKFAFDQIWTIVQFEVLDLAWAKERVDGGSIKFGYDNASKGSVDFGDSLTPGSKKYDALIDHFNTIIASFYLNINKPYGSKNPNVIAIALLMQESLDKYKHLLKGNHLQLIEAARDMCTKYLETMFREGVGKDDQRRLILGVLPAKLDSYMFTPFTIALENGWVTQKKDYKTAATGWINMWFSAMELVPEIDKAQLRVLAAAFLGDGIGLYKLLAGGADEYIMVVLHRLYLAKLVRACKDAQPQGLLDKAKKRGPGVIADFFLGEGITENTAALSIFIEHAKEIWKSTTVKLMSGDTDTNRFKLDLLTDAFDGVNIPHLKNLLENSGDAAAWKELSLFGGTPANVDLARVKSYFDKTSPRYKDYNGLSTYLISVGVKAVDRDKLYKKDPSTGAETGLLVDDLLAQASASAHHHQPKLDEYLKSVGLAAHAIPLRNSAGVRDYNKLVWHKQNPGASYSEKGAHAFEDTMQQFGLSPVHHAVPPYLVEQEAKKK